MLSHNSFGMTVDALRSLPGRSDQRSLDIIKRTYAGEVPYWRRLAVEALKGRTDEASLTFIEDLVRNPKSTHKELAITTLRGRRGPRVLDLIHWVLDNNYSFQAKEYVFYALEGFTDKRSLDLIEMGLNTANSEVRLAAARVLANRTDRPAFDVIKKYLVNPALDPHVQGELIETKRKDSCE